MGKGLNSDKFRPISPLTMMRVTNLADYAVLVMTAAARSSSCISAAGVARSTRLSQATAAKLLNTLAKGGLLVSTRGAAGGFALARGADAITLADIVEAVDGPIAITNCVSDRHEDCVHEGHCTTRGMWPGINAGVRGALAAVRLSELAGRREAL